MLPDHAGSECLVGRYRFTNHPTHGRGEFSTPLRECTESLGDEQHMIIFVLPGLNGGTFLYYNGGSFPNTKTRVDPVREQ